MLRHLELTRQGTFKDETITFSGPEDGPNGYYTVHIERTGEFTEIRWRVVDRDDSTLQVSILKRAKGKHDQRNSFSFPREVFQIFVNTLGLDSKLVKVARLTAGNIKDMASCLGQDHNVYGALNELADRLNNATVK